MPNVPLRATKNSPGDRALDLLRRLINAGNWYTGSIELSAKLDGQQAHVEALHILAEAKKVRR